MKHIKLISLVTIVILATGCAGTAKYDAWSKVETSKNAARAAQAQSLATVAATSKNDTLAAFAVFSLAQLKDSQATSVPNDDLLEYIKVLAPLGASLWSKNLDVILQTRINNNATIERMHTTDALVATPKTVAPLVVNPVIVEVPVPME